MGFRKVCKKCKEQCGDEFPDGEVPECTGWCQFAEKKCDFLCDLCNRRNFGHAEGAMRSAGAQTARANRTHSPTLERPKIPIRWRSSLHLRLMVHMVGAPS